MVGIYPTYLEKTMKTGIKETKELLRFVFSLANAVKESLSDGDLSLWDAKKFIEPLTLLVDALDNIDQILPELQDLDEDEISELVTFMMTELGVKIKIRAMADYSLVFRARTRSALSIWRLTTQPEKAAAASTATAAEPIEAGSG